MKYIENIAHVVNAIVMIICALIFFPIGYLSMHIQSWFEIGREEGMKFSLKTCDKMK